MSKSFQLATLASLAAITKAVESSPYALASGQAREMRAALADVEKAVLAEGGEPPEPKAATRPGRRQVADPSPAAPPAADAEAQPEG